MSDLNSLLEYNKIIRKMFDKGVLGSGEGRIGQAV
jgi:hypothetical protein